MSHSFFISAYATSVSSDLWKSEIESHYFESLAHKPEIRGIEHPFLIHSEKYPIPWLVDNIPDHWSIIITALPVFMTMAKTNPSLGLASVHEKDRQYAVNIMEKINVYVHQLNQAFCRKVVKAVHLHSHPKNEDTICRGNKAALIQSLRDIKNFDWDDASLNLEHCDAAIPNQISDKGFLSLEDEIDALCQVGGYGMVLNWARSAIEGRNIEIPLTHIHMAKEANLLKGYFFSGCTDKLESSYGCWKDSHMPPQKIVKSQYLDNDSLLGHREIRDAFKILNLQDHYLGIKVSYSAPRKNLEKAIGMIIDTIDSLNSL